MDKIYKLNNSLIMLWLTGIATYPRDVDGGPTLIRKSVFGETIELYTAPAQKGGE